MTPAAVAMTTMTEHDLQPVTTLSHKYPIRNKAAIKQQKHFAKMMSTVNRGTIQLNHRGRETALRRRVNELHGTFLSLTN